MKKSKQILSFLMALMVSAFIALFAGNALANGAGHPENAVTYSLVILGAGALVSYGMAFQSGLAFAALAYTSVSRPAGGTKNMGGTKAYIFFAALGDFATIGTLPPTPTTFDQLAVISDDHTFITGKCFRRLPCTIDKGTAKYAMGGERDGRSWKPEGEIIIPGDNPIAMGLLNQVANDQVILLIGMPSGRVIQIGTEDFPTELMGEFDIQKNSTGLKGFPVKFSTLAPDMLQYAGVISETPAP
jgi:hypothetical protein